MNKIKPLIFITIFLVISLIFGLKFKEFFINFSGSTIKIFFDTKSYITNSINEHLRQIEEIESLRTQNKELQKSAILLGTFANELNKIILDRNSTKFDPKVQLIRVLSYVKVGDYNKFWVDFKDMNSSKIYGVISHANTAGILVNNANKAELILQNDESSLFSVFIGESKIPGFAVGTGKSLIVKFIPQWLNPKIGDEIYTSGLDGIFFGGIKVGIVEKIIDEDLYKSVAVKSYLDENLPEFLYVITKER